MKIYAMISHWPRQAGISVLTKKFVVFWLSVTEFILRIMVANFDKSRQKRIDKLETKAGFSLTKCRSKKLYIMLLVDFFSDM